MQTYSFNEAAKTKKNGLKAANQGEDWCGGLLEIELVVTGDGAPRVRFLEA